MVARGPAEEIGLEIDGESSRFKPCQKGRLGIGGLSAAHMKGELMLKKGSDRGMRRWRAVALLATGVAVGVTMMATPAASHVGGTVGHLWNDHIKPRADARYVNAVPGTDAAPKIGAVTIVNSAWTPIPASGEVGVTATCPAGTYVVGGGAWSYAGSPDPYVNSSWPDAANSWKIYVWNPTSSTTLQTRAYAVCIAANSATYPATSAARASR